MTVSAWLGIRVTLPALALAASLAAADEPLVPGSLGTTANELVFAPLVPCRVVDTRRGGGVFGPFEIRNFVFRGPTTDYSAQGGSPIGCGVPGLIGPGPLRNLARAVVVNVVAVNALGPGDLRAWAPNHPEPNASILNYAQVPGLNLANALVLPLCDEEAADPCVGKDLSVKADVSGTQVLIDVLGYFHEPETLGDVTGVTAGVGLEGGGAAGELTLGVDFAGNGTAATVAHSDHDHDALYSPLGHNHDALYSPIAHNHDARYSLLAHNHDAVYSAIAHNHFGQTWTGAAGDGIVVSNTSTAVNANGLRVLASGTGAVSAVFADASGATGNNVAVNAFARSNSGIAVLATSTSATGATRGVVGTALSPAGVGVVGTGGTGVLATSTQPTGIGVLAQASSATGANYGLFARTESTDGNAIFGFAPALTGNTVAVNGQSSSQTGTGVAGVSGFTAGANTGPSVGVLGQNYSTAGTGVRGEALGLSGVTRGVWGRVTSAGGYAGYFSGGRSFFEGFTGIGTDTPTNQLHVAASLNFDATPPAHVALIENTSPGASADVLALQIHATSAIGAANNFITFFNGASASLGSIEGNGSGGVVFAGPGNDYAEWLPRSDSGRELEPGDVVGVTGGRVDLAVTPGARAMVVSTAPIVAGNDPGAARRRDHALVALLGQAEVRARGPVSVGDYLVPSGRNDGTAVAVPQAEATTEALAQVLGQAWEASRGAEITRVRALVGLFASDPLARLLVDRDRQQRGEIAALRGRLDDLERRLANGASPSASRSARR